MSVTDGKPSPLPSPIAGATGEGGIPRVRLRGIRKAFGSIEALRGVDLDL